MNSTFAYAGDGYGGCYVHNGTAYAMFCSPTSDSGSGTGWITVFDRNGSVLDRSMAIWVGIAIMGCDEVDAVSVDSEAFACEFDLGR